jgi:putative tryptophan/tyrosine transport system substrate-binding protein
MPMTLSRRKFITGFSGTAAILVPSHAAYAENTARLPKIGVLTGFAAGDPEAERRISAFLEELRKLGWEDGRNVRIGFRWGAGSSERIMAYVTELVAEAPDVILANSALVVEPLARATRTIPIVFVQVTDPVGAGWVASLAHPDRNMTGFTNAEFGMGGKMLELLKEIAPRVDRVLVILGQEQMPQFGLWRAIEAAAPALGVQARAASVHSAGEIEREINATVQQPNAGIIVLPNPVTNVHRDLIIALAAQHRLPAIYAYRYFVSSGGLISYGIDPTDQYRRAASYVDRILKGQKPGDLPVQQATRFDLVINLKTANELGLAVPPTLLARSDEVIE